MIYYIIPYLAAGTGMAYYVGSLGIDLPIHMNVLLALFWPVHLSAALGIMRHNGRQRAAQTMALIKAAIDPAEKRDTLLDHINRR